MVLGITGFKQSGKSTIANYLKESHGFYVINFADPIKDACRIMFDWTEEHVNGTLKQVVDPRWGITPRQALQVVGTEIAQTYFCEIWPEFKKHVGTQLWVKIAESRIKALQNEYRNFVIGDVRFPHEMYLLDQLWRTHRDSTYDASDLHASEIHIPELPANEEISNNGAYTDLWKKVGQLIYRLETETTWLN